MMKSLLIANRGEIACRIMETASAEGLRTIAIYSDADRDAKHVAMADEAYRVGPAPVSESYLQIETIIDLARKTGADAIHPGYGFLSENPEFVEAVEAAGIIFVGPPASAIRAMGLKDAAKALMEQSGVPVVPGYHGDNQDAEFLAAEAGKIGYPVLIKARAGGGGKGMRLVEKPEDFKSALEGAQREGLSSFGDDRVLVEKYVSKPRHIEVQVFGDSHGNAVHLYERDCSLQRRHQKVIEEAPAPGMTEDMRAAMGAAAVKAAKAVGYEGAGTVEFIVDGSDGLHADRFWFMEMNTRLQVEHPVTEMITGLDLVSLQLKIAAGHPLPFTQEEIPLHGWAFEARVYAEDATRNFMPATGTLTHLNLPDNLARIDTGVRQGDTITPFYDPMIAKVIVSGATREQALSRLCNVLDRSEAVGCTTNIAFLSRLARNEAFAAGDVDTGLIERHFEALTVQEAPADATVATAALYGLGLLAAPASADPWDTLSGWRHWSEARQHITLSYDQDMVELLVVAHGQGRFTVEWGNGTDQHTTTQTITVLGAQGNQYRLDLDGLITITTIIPGDGQITLIRQGEIHTFGLPDQLADTDGAGAGDNTVLAPLPGIITKLFVARDEAVTTGQPLLVMEAMKMEHTLTAPCDGTIDMLQCAEGQQVQEGTMLVRIESEEAD